MVALVISRLVNRSNGLSRSVNRLNRLTRLDRLTRLARLTRLTEDKRGSILVQTLLILPIFLLIVLGGYEVWKAISVKQSLHSGTYQATRYLCLNPVEDSLDPEEWKEVAEDFIVPELANNGLVGEDVAEQVRIYVTPPRKLDCDEPFTIRAELPWRAFIPYVPEHWTFVEEHEGRIACGP